MRIFLDTEFNGWEGQMISIGLSSEDGKDFYAVLDCNDPVPWVKENVMPWLMADSKPYRKVQQELWEYLNQFHGLTIIADWPQDFINFYQLLYTGDGMMMTTPPIYTELVRGLRTYPLIPHNAIEDARALKKAYIGGDLAYSTV